MKRIFLSHAILALAIIGCQPKKESLSENIAEYRGQKITKSEFLSLISTLPQDRRVELNAPDKHKIFFDDIAQSWVLSLEAELKYPHLMAEVNQKTSEYFKRDLSRLFYQRHIQENLGIDEKVLQAEYEKDKLTRYTLIPFDSVRKNIAEEMVLKNVNLQGYFLKNKKSYGDSAQYDSVKTRVQQTFIREYRDSVQKNILEFQKKKYSVIVHPRKSMDPLAYYQTHQSEFMSSQQWKIFHIESADSLSLIPILKLKKLTDFQKSASKINMNRFSKKSLGALGWIKENKTLPYDLGDLSALAVQIKNQKSPGVIPQILKANNGQFQVYWLDSTQNASLKPFDLVKSQATEKAKATPLPVEKNEVLVSWKNNLPLITGEQILTVTEEIPMNQRKLYPPERLAEVMMTWELNLADCVEQKWDVLDRSVVTNKVLRTNFLSYIYRDSLSKNDSLLLLRASQSELKYEFLKNNANYGSDTSESAFNKNKKAIFNFIKTQELSKIVAREIHDLMIKNNFTVKDSAFSFPVLHSPREILNMANQSRKANKADVSQYFLNSLYILYPESPLNDTALYALGQSNIDLRNYSEAIQSFDKHIILYPQSKYRDKSIFMKGFIYSEYDKNDTLSVQEFDRLMKEYPKSELFKDADFMAKDIRSGRKLSEDLMKKLEEAHPIPQTAPVTESKK
jgi:TolA-binding protein